MNATTTLTRDQLYRAIKRLRELPRPQPMPVRLATSTRKLREMFPVTTREVADADLEGHNINVYGMKVVIQEHLGEMVSIALDSGGFLLWNGSAWLQIPPLEQVSHLPVVRVRLE